MPQGRHARVKIGPAATEDVVGLWQRRGFSLAQEQSVQRLLGPLVRPGWFGQTRSSKFQRPPVKVVIVKRKDAAIDARQTFLVEGAPQIFPGIDEPVAWLWHEKAAGWLAQPVPQPDRLGKKKHIAVEIK